MIYFIQGEEGGPIKIGHTATKDRVRKRLGEIQVGASAKLVLRAVQDGGLAREAELHARFKEWRLNGEWFAPAYEICELCDGVGREVQEAYERGTRDGHHAGWELGLKEGRLEAEDTHERNQAMRLKAQADGRMRADDNRRASAMLLALTTEEQRRAYYIEAPAREVYDCNGISHDERLAIMKGAFKTKAPV